MKSIRKLGNFNFQWTTTLYRKFSSILYSFSHFSAINAELYEITPKKRSEPEKTNFNTSNFTK